MASGAAGLSGWVGTNPKEDQGGLVGFDIEFSESAKQRLDCLVQRPQTRGVVPHKKQVCGTCFPGFTVKLQPNKLFAAPH